MAADGTIYTSHWLYTAGGPRCLHIRDLIAKVIQLDAARGAAAAAAAVDRSRVIYETEWQAATAHAAPHAGAAGVSSQAQARPVFVLAQPGAEAQAVAMPRPAHAAAGAVEAAGAAFATCIAQTELLQTVAAGAGLGSSMQLLSQSAQPVARAPVGCHVDVGASASALSMQSMMRVAAMEFGAVQWASADVARAYPQPLPRWACGRQLGCRIAFACLRWRWRLTLSPHTCQPQPPCRPPASQALQQHAAEAAGLDMYGRTLQAGTWVAPRLLVREPPPNAKSGGLVAAAQAAEHLAGTIVVTGGMGALGTVVAQWLTSLGGCDLWLLGRSGRTSELCRGGAGRGAELGWVPRGYQGAHTAEPFLSSHIPTLQAATRCPPSSTPPTARCTARAATCRRQRRRPPSWRALAAPARPSRCAASCTRALCWTARSLPTSAPPA